MLEGIGTLLQNANEIIKKWCPRGMVEIVISFVLEEWRDV